MALEAPRPGPPSWGGILPSWAPKWLLPCLPKPGWSAYGSVPLLWFPEGTLQVWQRPLGCEPTKAKWRTVVGVLLLSLQPPPLTWWEHRQLPIHRWILLQKSVASHFFGICHVLLCSEWAQRQVQENSICTLMHLRTLETQPSSWTEIKVSTCAAGHSLCQYILYQHKDPNP